MSSQYLYSNMTFKTFDYPDISYSALDQEGNVIAMVEAPTITVAMQKIIDLRLDVAWEEIVRTSYPEA